MAQRHLLVAAAWLHDIGYSTNLVRTGLHALDGAAFCRAQGFPDTVVSLVAYHSGAEVEADERGLLGGLCAWETPPTELLDRLTAADFTTGPDGRSVTVRDRVSEILSRHSPDHPVHRAVRRSGPLLITRVEQTQKTLLRRERAIAAGFTRRAS
jgi:hypothetical protein